VPFHSSPAQALGIGYAPKGMMKGYVAIPIRLPTGELTGYIGITESPSGDFRPDYIVF